ncbi:hypothetical protein ACOSP7_017287 [Xanthoceras sorbifolium]
MAARCCSSSTVRDADQALLSAPPIEFFSLARIVNFNLPVKLDRDNYIHWKVQVLPTIQAFELDAFVSNLRPIPPKYIEVQTDENHEKEVALNKGYTMWRRFDKLLI